MGVPLARRNLVSDRRGLLAGVLGVGLSVMLILLLDGLWAGVRAQASVYTDRSGAALYVLQPGIRDLAGAVSVLPVATAETVRAAPGVAWADPVRTAYKVLDLNGRKVPVYVVGAVPGARGGPWALVEGRAPAVASEITLGTVVARRHGLEVGDVVTVTGVPMTVVGLSDGKGFMFDYVFVTHAALNALSGTPDLTSVVLVGTDAPAAVAARLRAGGLHVLTREEVGDNDVAFATGVFGSAVRLMVGIGFAAGTMIIALTAYTAVSARRREYGVVKAIGGTPRRLVALSLAQTLILAALGLAAGAVLLVVARSLLAATRPQFDVALTAGSVGRATAVAMVMALLAAVIPARRLLALDPAAAYRGAP